jgi:tripartite-type tricarboxylate transporter receptor subunit TctC
MTHPMNRSRRRLLAAGASASGLAALPVRAQANFPRGPVRVIVALPPGGAADGSARTMATVLEKSLKQTVIVENRPGGQFQIAMQALAAAPADGHTLLHVFNSFASVHAVQKLFDLEKQVTPVSTFGITPIALLVRGDSPHRSLQDLIGWARANPGALTYSTLGPGSVEHLKMAQIEQSAGFRGVAVPYRGGPDPMHYWGGYVVRAGTPTELVQRLHKELAAAAYDRAIVERTATNGGMPAASASPEEFRALISSEIAWMGEAAKALGLIKS